MDLEKQICSLKLAKELAALGVGDKACWYWCSHDSNNSVHWDLESRHFGHSDWYAAYGVAELGELFIKHDLQEYAHLGGYNGQNWQCCLGESAEEVVYADTQADIKAMILIWQLEQSDREVEIDPPKDVSCVCHERCDCAGIASNPPYPVTSVADVLWNKKYIVDDCEPDAISHPSHYTSGGMEVIDFIEVKQLGFHLGNAVKYIARAGKKDNYAEDLKEAHWYVERAIQNDSDHYAELSDKRLTEDFIIAKGLTYLLGYAVQYIVDAGADNYISLKKALGYIDRAIDAVEE